MAFSTGNPDISLNEIKNSISEASLVANYLGIYKVPCFINSPLRQDKRPSFGLYSSNGERIYFVDLATGERGGIYDLLSQMWHCSYKEVLIRIYKDFTNLNQSALINKHSYCHINTKKLNNDSELRCKIRKWKQYDLDYWESYGISLKWLKYAEVYPISHKIIISNGKKCVFSADKLAYAFVEHKENKITLKIYQPFNKKGYKWSNKHDRSVISLWAKIPEYGDKVVICSSLKDALCLWANVGIPALAVQGEGYGISNTAIQELKRRYKNIYILFDNDKAGLEDGKKLADKTNFTNLVIPQFEGGKDISDYFKVFGKEKFIETFTSLFKEKEFEYYDDIPF